MKTVSLMIKDDTVSLVAHVVCCCVTVSVSVSPIPVAPGKWTFFSAVLQPC